MKEARVILNRLLDKYENSKHLFQPGSSARRVMLRIDRKELPEYDYQDPSVRDAYNAAAVELERQSLVRLEWSRENLVLSIITLNLEPIMECYGQAGRVHPRVEAERFSALVEERLAGISVPWIAAWRDAVCAEARERWKVPSFCKEGGSLLPDLLEAFCRYAELSDSVTMRAFSSQCFHDTKYFERNVREGFLRIARRYNTDLVAACEEGELSERDQLAFLGIYARPELYELAGICTIQTRCGGIFLGAAEPYGLALPSTMVEAVTDVDLTGIRRITFIENKTNYDEYLLSEKRPEELAVYHGGFLSPQKRKLFAKIGAAAGDAELRFWADIDLGGFCMFERLQALLPSLRPMRMDGSFVEQYRANGLPRSEQYLAKVKAARQTGLHPLFADAIGEILKAGVTIEQEVFLSQGRGCGAGSRG